MEGIGVGFNQGLEAGCRFWKGGKGIRGFLEGVLERGHKTWRTNKTRCNETLITHRRNAFVGRVLINEQQEMNTRGILGVFRRGGHKGWRKKKTQYNERRLHFDEMHLEGGFHSKNNVK